jgi:hypothetical protein
MATFSLFGKSVDLPAMRVARRISSEPTAWEQQIHITVQLTTCVEALRLHTKGRAFPGRLASREEGSWLLIGDDIMTLGELADSRALPVDDPTRLIAATHVSLAQLPAFSVLNIGLAAKVKDFGGRGGEFQAEYVEGQAPIRFIPLDGKRWHTHAGRA